MGGRRREKGKEQTYSSVIDLTDIPMQTASAGDVNNGTISLDAEAGCCSTNEAEGCADVDLHDNVEGVVNHRV
jgi:hypothetical protein